MNEEDLYQAAYEVKENTGDYQLVKDEEEKETRDNRFAQVKP